MEVVDNLCQDASPIDGVDCAEVQMLVSVLVGKEGLDNILEIH